MTRHIWAYTGLPRMLVVPGIRSTSRALVRVPSPHLVLRYTLTTRGLTSLGAAPTEAPPKSRLRRFISFTALALFFTFAGLAVGLAPGLPIMQARIQLPSDDETLSLFQPPDPISAKIDEYIKNHPVALLLRQNPDFTESRPHLKLHETIRSHNFTGGTLAGPDKIVVPPLTFSEKGGKTLTAICYLGRDLCGHPNIIHGGLLATMLDEAMARCCFPALPHKLGMTANLTMNYRAPLPANSYVCIRATTTKVEGRKAWVEAWIESLPAGDEQPTLFVEATSLFIEPKHARALADMYPAAAA